MHYTRLSYIFYYSGHCNIGVDVFYTQRTGEGAADNGKKSWLIETLAKHFTPTDFNVKAISELCNWPSGIFVCCSDYNIALLSSKWLRNIHRPSHCGTWRLINTNSSNQKSVNFLDFFLPRFICFEGSKRTKISMRTGGNFTQ